MKDKTPKQEEIEAIERFIVTELDKLTTPMELMVERDTSKMEKANVLYNLFKILQNYDELEPSLKEFFVLKKIQTDIKKEWGESYDAR